MVNKGYEAAKEKIRDYHKNVSEKTKESYLSNPKICPQCQSIIPYEKRFDNTFCSRSCSAIFYNNGRPVQEKSCEHCGEIIKSKHYPKYCSKKCWNDHNYEVYINQWLAGEVDGISNKNGVLKLSNYVRKWVLNKANNQCEECGWNKINPITNKSPLNIHHIDGNSENNTPNNLKALCPNCHSLTSNYGSLNKGNGRKNRYPEKFKKEKIINKCVNCNKEISPNAKMCQECNFKTNHRKIKNRPNKELLLQLVEENGYEATGRQYGVTGASIKKWLK